jgi:hypothetical protein
MTHVIEVEMRNMGSMCMCGQPTFIWDPSLAFGRDPTRAARVSARASVRENRLKNYGGKLASVL